MTFGTLPNVDPFLQFESSPFFTLVTMGATRVFHRNVPLVKESLANMNAEHFGKHVATRLKTQLLGCDRLGLSCRGNSVSRAVNFNPGRSYPQTVAQDISGIFADAAADPWFLDVNVWGFGQPNHHQLKRLGSRRGDHQLLVSHVTCLPEIHGRQRGADCRCTTWGAPKINRAIIPRRKLLYVVWDVLGIPMDSAISETPNR